MRPVHIFEGHQVVGIGTDQSQQQKLGDLILLDLDQHMLF
jgi:hypothetical protein